MPRKIPRSHPSVAVRRIVRRELDRCAATYARGDLLDIGCGDRSKEAVFGPFVDRYVGLDHADTLHGLAGVDIVADAYAIPRPDESFDTIICTAVLEHLERPFDALREAHRLLRPGGRAIYTVPLFWHIHEAPRDFFRYTRYGLTYLFEENDFRLVELKPLSGFWMTFGTAFGYYLQNFRRGPVRFLVDAIVLAQTALLPALDRIRPRDERFTWMYLVVAERPAPPAEAQPDRESS